MSTNDTRITKKPVEFSYDARAPIRSAFEKTVTAAARLAAFASYRGKFGSSIDDKLGELAVDDLLALAIHGRRLIETAGARHCISKESIVTRTPKGNVDVPLARILNAVVHHRRIVLFRRKCDILPVGNTDESLKNWLSAANIQLTPTFAVKSDKGDLVVFQAAQVAEAFAERVISSVVEHCEAHGLDLESLFD